MRDELAQKVINLILGPLSGENEITSFRPLNLYTTGVLYPQVIKNDFEEEYDENPSENNREDESESQTNSKEPSKKYSYKSDDEEIEEEEELKLATNFSPSSMGFSFIVENNHEFSLEYSFGRYREKREKDKDIKWERIPYRNQFTILLQGSELLVEGQSISDKWIINDGINQVKLNFYVRNFEKSNTSKKLITISLINALSISASEQRKDIHCVFQASLKVFSQKSTFHYFDDYTDYSNLVDDYEALNIALLFKNYRIFAMGHGTSVDWKSYGEYATEIQTKSIPEETVQGVKFDIPGDSTILEMKKLAGPSFNQDSSDVLLKKGLLEFVKKYGDWISDQNDNLLTLPVHDNIKQQGHRNLEQCSKLLSRLINGIELIYSDVRIKKAFYDANRAMFMQRAMSSFSKWRTEKRSVIPGTEKYEDLPLPDFSTLPSEGRNETDDQFGVFAKWRPFQLAFIISQIKGIVDPNSEDRNTTDLIWFPTGGGKTEAYLGLIAFTLFYRRLREVNPDHGSGVSVMMRYTLRMLNLDQFQRANILISALDIIRSKEPQNYGTVRFSSGIWVGRSLTPNKYKDKQDGVDYGYNSNMELYIHNIEKGGKYKVLYSPFLFNCPCCGNRLVKVETKEKKIIGEWGYFKPFKKGDKKDPTGDFVVSCTNNNCHYYTEKSKVTYDDVKNNCFPFYTVDDEIYLKRPSLLFGTVDKYAQIAWKRDSARLFNLDCNNNNELLNPGPELIIQDELHLIGSSLGTIYGLFEYAIDKLCSLNGIKPKVVGATATVKNAEIQCRRLYDRKHFLQFPPPGIDADDSFYMRKNIDDKNPRKYIGFMASGFTSSTAIIRLASVLMEAPNTLIVPNNILDKYYTLLVYFNSLKELGKFRTFLDDDIFAYRKFLASQVIKKIHQNYSGRDIELSSAMTADDITMALENLKKEKLKEELKEDDKLLEIRKKGIRSILDWRETTNKKEIMSSEFLSKFGIEFKEDYSLNKSSFEKILNTYYKTDSSSSIKIATATNMIATGVDISRLNVMLINGHPKSSAEYIQASSRVGREDAGLIISFYSATKNRDRSHYENFKSFHQAFYKYVEPASVTPHSQPAIEKIIPTIVIALSWILYRKSSNEKFIYNDDLESFIDQLKIEIENRFGAEVKIYLNEIIEKIKSQWSSLNPPNRRFANFSDYRESPLTTIGNFEVLDVRADYSSLEEASHLVPKVTTMRDVEPNCEVKIK